MVRVVEQPGSATYARDGRYTGALKLTRPHVTGAAPPQTILIQHNPRTSTERWFEVLAYVRLGGTYRPFYCDPSVRTLHSDSDGTSIYRFPQNCRRGSIMFQGLDQSVVMVVFHTGDSTIKSTVAATMCT